MKTFLFGLDYASHDFSSPQSLGKNTFTNAFPLSICQYLSIERELDIPVIKAVLKDGKLNTDHVMTPWGDIIGVDPSQAKFNFECVYSGYKEYTHTGANKSDVVVSDLDDNHKRPLEIKLVVVPTSNTAKYDRENQSCEIVVRPPTVEQLAFSIAHSYGESQRVKLQELIVDALGKPSDYKWSDEKSMIAALPNILEAAKRVCEGGLKVQTPLELTAIWRSEGQKPILDEYAFDAFVWTDMAFMQLFMDQIYRNCFDKNGDPVKPKSIARPSRSLVWLIKSLWDYSTQRSLDFSGVHSNITFDAQSDKAGSFTGASSLKHLKSEQFFYPRIARTELSNILNPDSNQHLLPERRLDAAIAIQSLAQELSQKADMQED